MIVLGVCNGETASASIMIDGQLIAAVSEERFSRIKMDSSFPHRSINYCLRRAGASFENLDVIAYAWSKGLPEDVLSVYTRRAFELAKNPEGYAILEERINVEGSRDLPKRTEFWQWVASLDLPDTVRVEDYHHHEAHAYSAAAFSGYGRSAVLTCDGRGDYESLAFWLYDRQEGKLTKLFSSTSADSLGFFYGRITGILGFTPCRHEGKITGLAAFGNLDKAIDLMRSMIDFDGNKVVSNLGQLYRPFYTNYSDTLVEAIAAYSREDIAAAAQFHLEHVLVRFTKHMYRKHNLAGLPLCLAGGVFGNVKANQALKAVEGVGGLFVQPQMGDGGLCLGAAAAACLRQDISVKALAKLDLGPGAYDEKFETFIRQVQSPYVVKQMDDAAIIALIIENIQQGFLVGLVRGRMEFGPRALCQRSILYKCGDKSANDWMNARMQRSEFMPFAPVMTEEFAWRHIEGFSPEDKTFRYMTCTGNVSSEFARVCPAVTHVDNTARPQVINKDSDPWLHDLLSEWYARSGEFAMINTSFNRHEEPIVASYRDAFANLQDGVIDLLVIDDTVISKRTP